VSDSELIFENAVGQDSLTRFDRPKRRNKRNKRRKNKNRNKKTTSRNA